MSQLKIRFWSTLGSMGILLALLFSKRAGVAWDLYLIAGALYFFPIKFGRQGFFASFFLLITSSFAMHLVGDVHHLWRCGIEFSMGCSFLLLFFTWEVAHEEEKKDCVTLSSQKTRALQLEEEVHLLQEESTKERLLAIEKVDCLQRSLDELDAEKGALEILNDVLRKNQAASFVKEQKLEKELLEKENAIQETTSLLHQKEEEVIDLIAHIERQLCFEGEKEECNEEEIALLQELISHLFVELAEPRLSPTLREAFSSKKIAPEGPSLEETLRESLTSKRKKKSKSPSPCGE